MTDVRPIITLTTDFGTQDAYVASMKGVISSICRQARVLDISHDIPSQNIHHAAYVLGASYRYFPKGTVHVAVVDPGVGSERDPIYIHTPDYDFIAPDNGILSFVSQQEPVQEIYRLNNDIYFHKPVSDTFHGRDIFSACGAHRANGICLLYTSDAADES